MIDKNRMYDCMVRMVEAPSISGTDDEMSAVDKIEELLYEIPYFAEHRENVMRVPLKDDPLARELICAYLELAPDCPDTIILTGHYDVVDVDEYGPLQDIAFHVEEITKKIGDLHMDEASRSDLESGEWMFGRGTADMKIGHALSLELMRHYAEEGGIRGNILYVGVCGEETNSEGMLAAVPFFNGFLFSRVPIVEDEPAEQRTPLRDIIKTKSFVFLAVIMFTAGASELSMSQWASTFAEQGLGLSKFTGDLLGPCAFAFFMGVGRILHSFLPERIGIRSVLLFCGFITLGCYLCASLVDNSIIAVFACALCGLGVSAMWPGSYTLASSTFPHGGNAMFGMFAMFGDLGCSVGPWLAGLIAAGKGLKSALLICSIFPIISIAFLMLYRKNNIKEV